jgi:hypothetical protein
MARHGDAIYERGDTWWLDFVHGGQRHVHKLGKSINRTAARQLVQVKRAAILKGEVGIGPGPVVTVAEYAARWLKEVAPNLRPKTVKQYRQVLDLYVLPTLGATKLRALGRAAVKVLLNARSAPGLSKGTVRLVRATLSVMLGDAVEADLLKFNPAQLIPSPRTRGRMPRG